jgi:drug/metabolite transporter (DMT)-like permease
MSRGLQLEAAASATSLYYVKVVFSYVLGVLVLGEQPDLMGAAGAYTRAVGKLVVVPGFCQCRFRRGHIGRPV